ncbi:MAG: hypothetical protein IPM21_04440 [Acidobacteria bacterium]|nr:hypothetical protein [Acidobacteriota bacterium]
MDLIDELGSDLAVAILIEKRHSQKIESRQAIDLIMRIQGLLAETDSNRMASGHQRSDSAASQRSH